VPIIVDGHYPRATLHALSPRTASRPGGLRRRLTLLRQSFPEHPSACGVELTVQTLRRMTMTNPFVGPLLDAGAILLVSSIPMFVAGLIAAYGDDFTWRDR
jgi:hypothetical protein